MSTKLRLGAVLTLLVSTLFCVFFEISKHNPTLSKVNAFADDPYDAIGSFGIQAAAVLTVLSLIRAFGPYAGSDSCEKQQALLLRTEMLAVLTVGITLAGDAIAMARHSLLWMHSRGGHILLELLAGMILLTAVAGVFLYRAGEDIPLLKTAGASRKAALVSIAAILILALYPETLRRTLVGELFTVLIGDVLLFVPLFFLGIALVPDQGGIDFPDPVRLAWTKFKKHQWKLVVIGGGLMGLVLALAELREAGGWPRLSGQVVLVLAVFVALETAGLLLGYVFLKKPVGLC